MIAATEHDTRALEFVQHVALPYCLSTSLLYPPPLGDKFMSQVRAIEIRLFMHSGYIAGYRMDRLTANRIVVDKNKYTIKVFVLYELFREERGSSRNTSFTKSKAER